MKLERDLSYLSGIPYGTLRISSLNFIYCMANDKKAAIYQPFNTNLTEEDLISNSVNILLYEKPCLFRQLENYQKRIASYDVYKLVP